MSEERMIRVTESQFDELMLYAMYYTDNFDAWMSEPLRMYFEELEQAAPKDFAPLCSYMKLCEEGVKKGYIPCLQKCPYRNSEK